MNKPFPRVTFCVFGCEAANISFSPPEMPPDGSLPDAQAWELTQFLGDVAEERRAPQQPQQPQQPQSDWHEPLLETVRDSGLYAAVSHYALAQWQLLTDRFILNAADGLFCTSDDTAPGYDIRAMSRSGATITGDTLKLLEPYADHPGGLAVWPFWFRDALEVDFPIAVACDDQGRKAGWVVAPAGSWWPLPCLHASIRYMLELDNAPISIEQKFFEMLLRREGKEIDALGKLDVEDKALGDVMHTFSAVQDDLLQVCVAQSQRIAVLNDKIERLQQALANVTGVLRARN